MQGDVMRADVALVARALAESREKARSLIEHGFVTVNGAALTKPAQRVSPEDVLTVSGQSHPYVGRGGLKLEKALKVFAVDVSGLTCMDIGASTGGFTDVLLQNGASLVYAIDVGSGQLATKLMEDPRVVNMEHTNARALDTCMFKTMPSLAVMDVSFISIRLILPAVLTILGREGRMICLVKPQFEAGREHIGKRGIVAKPGIHRSVLRQLVDFVPTLGWRVRALDHSPIAGGDGNIEFIADLLPEERCAESVDDARIEEVVDAAHRSKL